jgi:NitT/TauT family transport system substrate-binding protein
MKVASRKRKSTLYKWSGLLRMWLVIVLLAGLVPSRWVWAQAPTSIVVGLASPSWSTQLPVAVAQQKGFFKEEGLNVTGITIINSPVAMAALVTGEIKFAFTGPSPIMSAITGGADVQIIGGNVNRVIYTLMGAKGIKSIQELKGKAVGSTAPGTSSDFMTRMTLRHFGLDPERDVKIIPAGGSSTRAVGLEVGRISAAPFSPESRVRLEEQGFPVLADMAKVLGEFPFNIIAANRGFLDRMPNATTGFLKGLIKAYRLIKANKDEAFALGLKQKLRGGDPRNERIALDLYADAFSEVKLSTKAIQAVIDAEVAAGRMAPVTVAKVFDGRFIDQAYQELGLNR